MSGGFSQSTPGGNVVNGAMVVSTTGSLPIVITGGTLLLSGATATTNGALETTQLLGIPKAPLYNSSVFRFTVTGSQSTHNSLLTPPRVGLVTAISASKVITMAGDPFTPVFFIFDNASTGHAISSVDNYGATQCDLLQAGERRDYIIPIGVSGLIVSASVTSSISLSVSS